MRNRRERGERQRPAAVKAARAAAVSAGEVRGARAFRVAPERRAAARPTWDKTVLLRRGVALAAATPAPPLSPLPSPPALRPPSCQHIDTLSETPRTKEENPNRVPLRARPFGPTAPAAGHTVQHFVFYVHFFYVFFCSSESQCALSLSVLTYIHTCTRYDHVAHCRIRPCRVVERRQHGVGGMGCRPASSRCTAGLLQVHALDAAVVDL